MGREKSASKDNCGFKERIKRGKTWNTNSLQIQFLLVRKKLISFKEHSILKEGGRRPSIFLAKFNPYVFLGFKEGLIFNLQDEIRCPEFVGGPPPAAYDLSSHSHVSTEEPVDSTVCCRVSGVWEKPKTYFSKVKSTFLLVPGMSSWLFFDLPCSSEKENKVSREPHIFFLLSLLIFEFTWETYFSFLLYVTS